VSGWLVCKRASPNGSMRDQQVVYLTDSHTSQGRDPFGVPVGDVVASWSHDPRHAQLFLDPALAAAVAIQVDGWFVVEVATEVAVKVDRQGQPVILSGRPT
jgi:hypothetical protein